MELSGIFVPTATPFEQGWHLHTDGYRSNLRRWLKAPVSGLVVGGSTGEALLLDEDERVELLTIAREELDDGRLLIAGTGAESTRATVRLTQAARAAGADAVLVQPPAFFRGAMTREALDRHYRELADAALLPIIVYQVPLKFSTLDLDNDWIAELSHHPNVVGIKDSRGRLEVVKELVDRCADDFSVLVGNGAILADALELGARGGILGVANLMPEECCEIHEAHTAGDRDRAHAVQARVAPVHNAIVGTMGVPGVKFALDHLGRCGGEPRPPLLPLADAHRTEVRELLAG